MSHASLLWLLLAQFFPFNFAVVAALFYSPLFFAAWAVVAVVWGLKAPAYFKSIGRDGRQKINKKKG